jgi:hypothetical protein
MIRASVCAAIAVIALAVAGCAEDNGDNTIVPDGVSVTPATLSLAVDETQNATAAFTRNGTAVTSGVAIVWTTSNPAVANVSPFGATGGITGAGPGTADITVSAGTASAVVHVTVAGGPPVTVQSLDIAPNAVAIPLGGVVPIHVGAVFSNGTETEVTDQVTWASDAAAIATAAGSSVTGVAQGTAHLTATYQGMTAMATVTVGAAAPHAMKITAGGGTTFHVAVGATLQLTATEIFTDGTTLDVTTDAKATWTAVSPTATVTTATIDNTTTKGLVSGKVAGTSLITVTLNAPDAPVTLTTNVTLTVDPALL